MAPRKTIPLIKKSPHDMSWDSIVNRLSAVYDGEEVAIYDRNKLAGQDVAHFPIVDLNEQLYSDLEALVGIDGTVSSMTFALILMPTMSMRHRRESISHGMADM
jgi:hypothetical protein